MALRIFLAGLTLLALGSGVLGCGPGGMATPPPTAAEGGNRLMRGDQFAVRVYGEEDLSSSYTVQPDGTIDYPYIGSVAVEGRSPAEVGNLLEDRLRDGGILVNPHVSIEVTQIDQSRLVAVSGAVRRPGNYPVTYGLTGLQAIGLAGGTTELANRDGAVITRRVEGRLRRYQLPLDRIRLGEAEDVGIEPGDIIYVPERFL